MLLLLGDQVYADTTPHPELEEFMAARRSLDEPPGEEIKDFVEYAELYRLAWSEHVIRWVLSTLPSAMIFDDHDIRDDWNTSWSWRREIRATTWWQERIVSGLGVLLGAPAPRQPLAGRAGARGGVASVVEHAASGATDELDLTADVDALAARADAEPTSYRWSYTRALGDCALVVIDSRAARELRPDGRSMLDADELRWVDGVLRGGVRHLFIGTSLPFLLPPGLHDFEAMDEAMAQGAYGRKVARAAEKLRRSDRPRALGRLQRGLRRAVRAGHGGGSRRARPGTADDHLPLRRRAQLLPRRGDRPACGLGAQSRVVQAVCSPIRNPMPRGVRMVMSLFAKSLVRPMRFVALALARRAEPAPTRGRSPTGPGSTTTSHSAGWTRIGACRQRAAQPGTCVTELLKCPAQFRLKNNRHGHRQCRPHAIDDPAQGTQSKHEQDEHGNQEDGRPA